MDWITRKQVTVRARARTHAFLLLHRTRRVDTGGNRRNVMRQIRCARRQPPMILLDLSPAGVKSEGHADAYRRISVNHFDFLSDRDSIEMRRDAARSLSRLSSNESGKQRICRPVQRRRGYKSWSRVVDRPRDSRERRDGRVNVFFRRQTRAWREPASQDDPRRLTVHRPNESRVHDVCQLRKSR